MVIAGIDLSLNSTGVCLLQKNKPQFFLIKPPKDLKGEDRIIAISSSLCSLIDKFNVTDINLEGLSFNSVSSSKDEIAGNFWYLRCKLREDFPTISLNIIPVTSWRSPLFNKEDKAAMKEANTQLKSFKKVLKGLKGQERIDALLHNENLINASSIKHQTFLKLPPEVQSDILDVCPKDGKYDLTDAYFLSLHKVKNK